jgi:thiol:disulfide interchange protein
MKSPLSLLFALGLLFAGCSDSGSTDASALSWRTNLDVARAVAEQSGKPLVVLYTGSQWCPPCQQMEAQTWPDPSIAALADEFVWVKFDAPRQARADSPPEQLAALAQFRKDKIRSVPTLHLFRNGKSEPTVLTGFVSANQLVAELNKAKAGF